MTDDRPIWRWIEVISILVIIGSVSAMAVPKYAALQRERVATQVLADVETVRKAVYAFYSDSAYFPEPVPGDLAPASLAPYLPPAFALSRAYGTIEYRNWPMPGAPEASALPASNVVGATVMVRDERIGAAAAALAEPRLAKFAVGNRYTFVFFGS